MPFFVNTMQAGLADTLPAAGLMSTSSVTVTIPATAPTAFPMSAFPEITSLAPNSLATGGSHADTGAPIPTIVRAICRDIV